MTRIWLLMCLFSLHRQLLLGSYTLLSCARIMPQIQSLVPARRESLWASLESKRESLMFPYYCFYLSIQLLLLYHMPYLQRTSALWLKSATWIKGTYYFFNPTTTAHTGASMCTMATGLAVFTKFNVYGALEILRIRLNLSPLSPWCLSSHSPPLPIPLVFPHLTSSSLVSASILPLFCPPVWSVAPRGEVLGQIDGVQARLWSARLCTFPHFSPSPSLPLCINPYSIPPFLHHSFFPTVLHSISSSHPLSSFQWRDPPSPLPLVRAFFFLPPSLCSAFSPSLPSSAWTD